MSNYKIVFMGVERTFQATGYKEAFKLMLASFHQDRLDMYDPKLNKLHLLDFTGLHSITMNDSRFLVNIGKNQTPYKKEKELNTLTRYNVQFFTEVLSPLVHEELDYRD